MTIRRTVLNVEQLGERVLPSTTATVVPTAATAAQTSTTTTTATTGSPWAGQGRFTLTTNSSTKAETYAFQGSATINSTTFYAISGTLTSVGNKSGQATGKVVLSAPQGTLTITVTGATQSANAALPTKFTYKVVSGTGAFAKYNGTGSITIDTALWPGFTDSGHFDVSATAPVGTITTPPPTTKPPTTKPPTTQTTTGPSWTGQGRYTLTTNSSTKVQTYALQGTADFGSSGYFAIGGTIQTVGNKSGQATGKVTLSDPRGTLTLSVTSATQSANSGLPAKLTYTVVSGTGFFAHYAGKVSVQISVSLFLGYDNAGHFDVAVKPST
jgi:DNA/RNA endonuclease YhcR with UshA esterase domain